MSSESKQISRPSRNHRSQRSNNGDGSTWSVLSESIPRMRYRFPVNSIHRIIKNYDIAAIITSTAVGAFISYGAAFAFGNLPDYTTYAAIFDQYKIEKVEMWLIPRNPNYPSGASVNRGLLFSVIDYDDQNVAGYTAATFEERDSLVVSPPSLGHYRSLTPHLAVAAYRSTGPGFTGYANMQDQWVDSAYPDVLHYGVKVGMSTADAAADVVVIDAFYRLHMAFRNTI